MMQNLLRDRVNIERMATPTPSASGDVTAPAAAAWTTIAGNIAAAIQPRSGNYRQREFGQGSNSNWRGFFQITQDIRVGDRVLFGTTRYQVTFLAPQAGHHIECDLAEILAP
jgi:hypothetical protein